MAEHEKTQISNQTLGQRLRMARESLGISQIQLEEMSGVKQGTISKIERGDQVRTTFVLELATALKVDPEWLVSGDGNQQGEQKRSRDKAWWDGIDSLHRGHREVRRFVDYSGLEDPYAFLTDDQLDLLDPRAIDTLDALRDAAVISHRAWCRVACNPKMPHEEKTRAGGYIHAFKQVIDWVDQISRISRTLAKASPRSDKPKSSTKESNG